jgi:hypothetical protein
VSTLHNFIDGRPCPAADDRTFDNPAPATGETLAAVARSSAADVGAAVAAAERAMAGPWGRTSAAERADLLDAIADGIQGRLEELAELESRDTGKPVWLARAVDIPRAVANFRFFAGAIRHDETGCYPTRDALNYTLRRPLGPVGLITPWNLPLYLLTWKTAPALGMGNTVVAKPSEVTPMTAGALAEIISAAGAPDGVFNTVHGFGAEAGQALLEHPGVKAISFTGGTVTGRTVARVASPMFKKVSLELGGKNATVVFADADYDAALEGAARAGFRNQGQICLCGSRILVERPIYERFVADLSERVLGMTVGDPGVPAAGDGHRAGAELPDVDGGDLRAGGDGAPVRLRGGGASDRQRGELRAGRVDLDERSEPGAPGRRDDRGGHCLGEHLDAAGPAHGVRRGEGLGRGARGRALEPGVLQRDAQCLLEAVVAGVVGEVLSMRWFGRFSALMAGLIPPPPDLRSAPFTCSFRVECSNKLNS